jgi:hypothetical protein
MPAKITVMTKVKKAMTQKANPMSLARDLMEQGYQQRGGQYMGVFQGSRSVASPAAPPWSERLRLAYAEYAVRPTVSLYAIWRLR